MQLTVLMDLRADSHVEQIQMLSLLDRSEYSKVRTITTLQYKSTRCLFTCATQLNP